MKKILWGKHEIQQLAGRGSASGQPESQQLAGTASSTVSGQFLELEGSEWYCIANYDAMPDFLMSMTSSDNFWFFVSTSGGLTCGRTDYNNALFPYYTVDKIHSSYNQSGSLTSLLIEEAGDSLVLWQPFAPLEKRVYSTVRNLYKSIHGDRIMFEEVNNSLGLRFRIFWETSPEFGIHRRCTLLNTGTAPLRIRLLDGMRNILPAGVNAQLQVVLSNLLNAYKRSERVAGSSLALYSLSAQLSDRPEPSESLCATTVWSYGLDAMKTLLSETQVAAFSLGADVYEEQDICGEPAAYFKCGLLEAKPQSEQEWGMLADLRQTHRSIVALQDRLQNAKPALLAELRSDIDRASAYLNTIIEQNDGRQIGGNKYSLVYHRSNILFNIMRGGYFIRGYEISLKQFSGFVASWNSALAEEHRDFMRGIGNSGLESHTSNKPDSNKADSDKQSDRLHLSEFQRALRAQGDPDLERLGYEFLPLTFGRRHGDPSRPWNAFSIETRNERGEPIIAYQGNWRDIFQNWEALCYSYPLFYPSVIAKFLNACTADGYNPYKLSQKGFDWEVPEPENPWSNIGYWSDHQIIYLTKLLEHCGNFLPQESGRFLAKEIFVYAQVPYRIRSFDDLFRNPHDSIVFDYELDAQLQGCEADGKLLRYKGKTDFRIGSATSDSEEAEIVHATMMEKLLVLLLAKLANYVPGGGIWMNTQRPEWNDANNALAGWGLSMVTLCYLTRFIDCLVDMLDSVDAPVTRADGGGNVGSAHFAIHNEVHKWFTAASSTMLSEANIDPKNNDSNSAKNSSTSIRNARRRFALLQKLGKPASEYRSALYAHSFSGEKTTLSSEEIRAFLKSCSAHFFSTIEYCQRTEPEKHAKQSPDPKPEQSTEPSENTEADPKKIIEFESYQILILKDGEANIRRLYPMLEGQVAGLSTGALSPQNALRVITGLKTGPLFRPDQYSYMLYPNRQLPQFLQKNTVSGELMQQTFTGQNLEELLAGLLEQDVQGNWHFNAQFKNRSDLEAASAHASEETRQKLFNIFEDVFKHSEFTGRSGTFFAYEGLGSIYWHMVSKLLLAVQEVLVRSAVRGNFSQELKNCYLDIRKGLGFNKSPAEYGAFPCDPYSHSPYMRGAKQPGMTGQVKEGILMRYAELGLVVHKGRIRIIPELILKDEWTDTGEIELSFCGVPFTLKQQSLAGTSTSAHYIRYTPRSASGSTNTVEVQGLELNEEISRAIFARNGDIESLGVYISTNSLS